MVERLLAAGYQVKVTNRTRAKAEALTEAGAKVADSPADLAGCQVVFTTVPSSEDLEAVITGPGGLLTGESSRVRVVVDCSTVSVESSARVRAALERGGIAFLAAPVSGNPGVVRAGRLSFAVSGPEAALAFARPLLEAIGPAVAYVGPAEEARLVKLCHNLFLGVVAQSLIEVVVLAEKAGVSRASFLSFLNASVLGSPFTGYKTPALVELDFTPTFTTTLLRKDFDLALAAARDRGVPMPLAALCAQLVAAAVGAGYGEADFASMLMEQARSAGLLLT